MLFLPISLALFFLFLLLIPVLFILAPAVAFAKMGLSPFFGYAFFILCLVGGGVNIPVYREKIKYPLPIDNVTSLFIKYLGISIPPMSTERIIALNLGGAILPSLLSIYLLFFVPISKVVLAIIITSTAAFIMSKPVKGLGIVMPPFVPPIIAAITAIIISRDHAPQLAYISGVMGTLIGADLLRIPQLRNLEAQFLSIGGAGIFDGIYLVGLVSVLLA
jgi:uncharacterized membrane protein